MIHFKKKSNFNKYRTVLEFMLVILKAKKKREMDHLYKMHIMLSRRLTKIKVVDGLVKLLKA